MSQGYTSRVINDAKDTFCMQSVLQKKPDVFFDFPLEWQEWFMTHPEMLHSSDGKLTLESMRELLYEKISNLLTRDNGEFCPGIGGLITLLLQSGLGIEEVKKQISLSNTQKTS